MRNKILLFFSLISAATVMRASAQSCEYSIDEKDKASGALHRETKAPLLVQASGKATVNFKRVDTTYTLSLEYVQFCKKPMKMDQTSTLYLGLANGNTVELAPMGEYTSNYRNGAKGVTSSTIKSTYAISKSDVASISKSRITTIRISFTEGSDDFDVKPAVAADVARAAFCILQ